MAEHIQKVHTSPLISPYFDKPMGEITHKQDLCTTYQNLGDLAYQTMYATAGC
jgi:hypothetical protein